MGIESSGSGLRASERETSNRAMRLVLPTMKWVPGAGHRSEAMGRYASVSCLIRRKEARGGGRPVGCGDNGGVVWLLSSPSLLEMEDEVGDEEGEKAWWSWMGWSVLAVSKT